MLQIDTAATLELEKQRPPRPPFVSTGTLKLDQPVDFTGTVAGLVLNDVIDLGGVTDVTATTLAGSTLTLIPRMRRHPNLDL